jgi:hypothetical protein
MSGSIVPPLLESDGAAVEGAGGVTFVAGGDSECHEEDGVIRDHEKQGVNKSAPRPTPTRKWCAPNLPRPASL